MNCTLPTVYVIQCTLDDCDLLVRVLGDVKIENPLNKKITLVDEVRC